MDSPTGSSIGSLIRARRAERGLTLQRLADMVDCAKSYLWQIEHDRRENPPSEEVLGKLERALGFEAGRLMEAAMWQTTPAPVKREMSELQTKERIARRLAELLARSGVGGHAGAGERTALDAAYGSGELRRLIDALAPEEGKGGAPGKPAAARSPFGALLPLEVPLINKVAAGYPTEFTDLGYPVSVADEYVRCPDLEDPDAFAARVVGDSMLPEYREGDIVVFSPARAVKAGMDCFARIEPDHESTFKRVYFEKDAGGDELIRLQPLNSAFPPRVLPRAQVAGLYAAVSVTREVGGGSDGATERRSDEGKR